MRTRKQALSGLLKKGCVGDEIWERLLRAEQELEEEVKDCVQEVCSIIIIFTIIYLHPLPIMIPFAFSKSLKKDGRNLSITND